jgi:hypothetical protein
MIARHFPENCQGIDVHSLPSAHHVGPLVPVLPAFGVINTARFDVPVKDLE